MAGKKREEMSQAELLRRLWAVYDAARLVVLSSGQPSSPRLTALAKAIAEVPSHQRPEDEA